MGRRMTADLVGAVNVVVDIGKKDEIGLAARGESDRK